MTSFAEKRTKEDHLLLGVWPAGDTILFEKCIEFCFLFSVAEVP
jgi:hypothetical protein